MKTNLKRGMFGENTNRPFVASTKQIVHIEQEAMGTTLDEVLKNLEETKITIDDLDGKVEGTVVEDGGEPSVDVGVVDEKINFAFKNLKGEKGEDGQDGQDGATGPAGPQGPQGDSAVYDPNDPSAPDFVMANTTGQSTTKAMTQKAVSDALVQERQHTDIGDIGSSSKDLMTGYILSQSYGYINANTGQRQTSGAGTTYKTTNRIYLRGYKAIRISICNTSTLTGFGFYDSDNNFMSGENGLGDYATSGLAYIEKIFPVPFGATYVALTKNVTVEEEPICVGIETSGGIADIKWIENDISELTKYDYETLKLIWEHKYINSSGQAVASDNYACSILISTENIRRVRSLADPQVMINVAFYREDYVFVKQFTDFSEDFTTLPIGYPYMRLWFACTNLSQANSLIEITRTIGVKEKVESLSTLLSSQSTTTINFSGNNGTVISKYFTAKAGHIYKFTPSKSEWLVSAVGGGNVVFGVGATEYIERITKGNQAYECFYAPQTDTDVTIVFRGNVGVKLDVLIEDVTLKFNSLKYDVAFVEKEYTQESMMVKLGQGDLARYIVNSDGENAVVKVYSRARRDEDYLVDSIVLPQGANEGEYMPTQDVFLVVESVKSTGFTPRFRVYNVGETNKELTYPHQLIFDSDNIQVILSTQDEDVTIYDDNNINYGQIIEHNGVYVLLYQAFGSWNDNEAATIMMAYSTDGENWQRGIPEGLPVPYEDTNIIFRGDGQIVGLFSQEHVDSFWTCKVNDAEYPYRMLACIRKTPSSIYGERYWLLKSANLTQWVPIKQVTEKGHDTIPSIVSYGDCIKAYVRMWDYSKPDAEQRMVGVMWMDLNGNVLVPPSGLYGNGLYNPAVTRIGPDREIALPTHFYAESSLMVGTDELESYIIDKDRLIYAPSYGIDELKYPETRGWVWGIGLCSIGTNQYFLLDRANGNHASTIQTTDRQLCLCPVKWVTYNTANMSS